MKRLQTVTSESLQTFSTETLSSGHITRGVESPSGVTVTSLASLSTHDVPVSVLTLVAVVTNNILLAGTLPGEGVTLGQLIDFRHVSSHRETLAGLTVFGISKLSRS